MSRFFSPKLLKYKSPLESAPIETDLACTGCGYNVRGLNFGRACPECGKTIERTQTSPDLLLAGDESIRARWRLGLLLAVIVIGFFAIFRFLLFFLMPFAPLISASFDRVLLNTSVCGTAVALLGLSVIPWLVTPRTLAQSGSGAHGLHRAARWLQLGWLVAALCTVVSFYMLPALSPWVDRLHTASAGASVVASTGFWFMMLLLYRAAVTADLDDAARRLNASIWLLWLPTLMVWAMPSTYGWIFFPLFLIVFVWWLIAMIILWLALREMNRHVRWSHQMGRVESQREERTQEVRAAFDREVEQQIRPVPPPSPDIPLADDS